MPKRGSVPARTIPLVCCTGRQLPERNCRAEQAIIVGRIEVGVLDQVVVSMRPHIVDIQGHLGADRLLNFEVPFQVLRVVDLISNGGETWRREKRVARQNRTQGPTAAKRAQERGVGVCSQLCDAARSIGCQRRACSRCNSEGVSQW